MSDKHDPKRVPLPQAYEQLVAENDALRKILKDYFDHDWGDKIGMWEEQAEKAIGRE